MPNPFAQLLGIGVLTVSMVGCGQPPVSNPSQPAAPTEEAVSEPSYVVAKVALPPYSPPTDSKSFRRRSCAIAFTSQTHRTGSLLVYDDVDKDVYILNGALAGLAGNRFYRRYLDVLNPRFFGNNKILFEFGGSIYVYDMDRHQRVTVATDGLVCGARPSVSENGLLTYIDTSAQLVITSLDGDKKSKRRVLTKVAADGQSYGTYYGFPWYRRRLGYNYGALDADISADGRWVVLNKNGILYLYDVANPRLMQVLPQDGAALSGYGGNVKHVSISDDGRYLAFTAGSRYRFGGGGRLLLLDRSTGLLSTVPYPNLGSLDSSDPVASPRFCGSTLYFEIQVSSDWRIWAYDLGTRRTRALVILNNALGERGSDSL